MFVNFISFFLDKNKIKLAKLASNNKNEICYIGIRRKLELSSICPFIITKG